MLRYGHTYGVALYSGTGLGLEPLIHTLTPASSRKVAVPGDAVGGCGGGVDDGDSGDSGDSVDGDGDSAIDGGGGGGGRDASLCHLHHCHAGF